MYFYYLMDFKNILSELKYSDSFDQVLKTLSNDT